MDEKSNRTCQLLSAKALAKILATSVRSIWRYRSSGRLPKPVQVGQGAIRWRQSDIEKWISWGCCSRREFIARRKTEKC